MSVCKDSLGEGIELEEGAGPGDACEPWGHTGLATKMSLWSVLAACLGIIQMYFH